MAQHQSALTDVGWGDWLFLGLILLGYGVAGTLYALYTPDWQAPDEPAHYNYVRQLAEGIFPVIEPSDYNQAYQNQVISSRFDPRYSIVSFRYEDHQPPLYYLLQTPLFWLTNGSLPDMRLLSLLFGAGVIVLGYGVARQLFGQERWLALVVPAFLAFLPQHLAILASVNNDSLAELLIAGMIWLLVHPPSQFAKEKRFYIFLGILLGLGFLTKATVYIMAPVLAGWVIGQSWGDKKRLWQTGLWLFVPALLLGSLWWGRNILVYDQFDPLANLAHNQVVVGQPTTQEWIATYGLPYTITQLLKTTFQSFWGQFGWMGVVMPAWIYQLLLLLTCLILIGCLLHWQTAQKPTFAPAPKWLLGAIFGFNLLLYLAYNLTFVQHQGRYLFPSLIPISIVVALGIGIWVMPFKRWGRGFIYSVPALFALALFSLSLLALFRFIIPSLS